MCERLNISIEEAAQMVGLSKTRFYPLVLRGEIASIKFGQRRLVPVAAVREWQAKMLQATTDG